MTKEELALILDKHKKWLKDDPDGERCRPEPCLPERCQPERCRPRLFMPTAMVRKFIRSF